MEQTTTTQSDTGAPETNVREGVVVVCPYCGVRQQYSPRCESCGGLFDPLSRQASQNQMGPWYIRDETHPHKPGCSYETLQRLIQRGAINADTVLRGPTTMQFWVEARYAPGVAHLLGECHNCHKPVRDDEYMCAACGVVFTAPADRQGLGLGPIRLLPGSAPAHVVAQSSVENGGHAQSPTQGAPPASAPSESPDPTAGSESAAPQTRGLPLRPVDASNAQVAVNRRLRRKVGTLRMIIGLLVVINVLLLLVLAIAMNPRLDIGGGSHNNGADSTNSTVDE